MAPPGECSASLACCSSNSWCRCFRLLTSFCQTQQFSPVQFSSRWYLCTWEGPYALHPSLRSFPNKTTFLSHFLYTLFLITSQPTSSKLSPPPPPPPPHLFARHAFFSSSSFFPRHIHSCHVTFFLLSSFPYLIFAREGAFQL